MKFLIYNRYIGKIRELILKNLYFLFKKRSTETFLYKGKKLKYFHNSYNRTWINERSVEVAIGLSYLSQYKSKDILEVGNVLSHYTDAKYDILDKYEEATGVINTDIVDFKSKKKYDLVLCISTLEHVGWDEDVVDLNKTIQAVKVMKTLLKPKGLLVITVPFGYNPSLDEHIEKKRIQFDEIVYLQRETFLNTWKQIQKHSIRNKNYDAVIMRANTILVGIIHG